jgi:hypothetical protein
MGRSGIAQITPEHPVPAPVRERPAAAIFRRLSKKENPNSGMGTVRASVLSGILWFAAEDAFCHDT